MANNLIPNPIGLQAIVNKLQVALYNGLGVTWSGAQLDGYPICYSKTNKDGKRIIGTFNEDVENLIYAEDNKFWFTIEQKPSQVSGTIDQYQAQIAVYFTVNLEEVKPNITTHRADYEARADVLAILERQGSVVRVVQTVIEIENVYRGYSYNKADDLQPYHCFKIVLNAYSFRQDLVIC